MAQKGKIGAKGALVVPIRVITAPSHQMNNQLSTLMYIECDQVMVSYKSFWYFRDVAVLAKF